jgi:FlaA1/EpsC-like NDP-sugar epimerase
MEQLNIALAKLIEQATAGIDASTSFLTAQVPDVILQLLMWNFVLNLAYFVLGILIFFFCIYLWRKIYRTLEVVDIRSSTNSEDTIIIGGGMLSALLLLPTFIFLNLTWLQIWIAPKVWLLEYGATLVK